MYLVVFEATLLGSGQMIHVGGITLKMILFSLSVLYVLVSLLCGDRVTRSSVLLLSYLFISIGIASFIGILSAAPFSFIGEDISPFLYFLILPFLELTMRTKREVTSVVHIIMINSMVMSAGYAVLLGALLTGAVSIRDLYVLLTDVGHGDFMYDGLTLRIFYKGSLYIAIAVIFFAFKRGRWAKIGLCISFIALLLTVTRGFLLALFFVVLVYAVIRPARLRTKLAYAFVIIVAGGIAIYASLGVAGDKTESDSIRLTTIDQVAARVNPVSLIVGHGFGNGVPERPKHMEIAYLEIFHKQGLVGLAWLASLGMLLIVRFRRAIRDGHRDLVYPLFLSAIFVFLESFTNPFINNPIGMSAVLISLAGLKALANPQSIATSKETVLETK
ncbi:MAG: O-antigen ligase family protein [Acidobacteriaceae bacterium]